MKRTYTVGALLAACVLWSNSFTSLDTLPIPSGSALRVVQSGAQGIVLELTVNDFHSQTVEYDGHIYQRLLIPDMAHTAKPSEPQVPTRGTLLGLPSIAGVSVQVLDTVYETLQGYRFPPAPTLEVSGDTLDTLSARGVQPTFAFNHALYATDAFYPGVPVEIGHTGYMRDQAVAQVQFYPVHYNPVTSEVRLYRRIRAQLTWEIPRAAATAKARSTTSPAYERVLKNTLLNYPALRRSARASQPPPEKTPAIEGSAASSATPALKIGVTKDGLYALTYSDLAAAGFDPRSIDPRTLTISNQGVEIPISVQGEDDGVFDPNDVILFYGTAITNIYTTKNVYWLTVGETTGQRMRTRDGALVGGATVPTHFPVTRHVEQNTYYWQTMPDGKGRDHWFWGDKLTAPASREHSLRLAHVSPTASTATVRVRLKGRTDDLRANPDHHTRILLNGAEIDNQLWNGQIAYTHHVTVPHASINKGENVITVEAVRDTGAVVDQVFVNWIEVGYWATYVAKNSALLFGAPAAGTFQFAVTGFRSGDVAVFDVTNPADVTLLTHTTVVPDGGTYTLKFEDTTQLETRYFALTSAQYKSPASLEIDHPSSWRSPNHGADYIIITHEDFHPNAKALAAHRRTGGLRVVTVKIGDIYDEFNHGIFHPRAIRRFLSYAYHTWHGPAPTYVLLIGDATQDYKDNHQTGTRNYVPSQIIETDLLGETPSDNWFVLVSGADILPDMFMGRLPVQTVAEAKAVVNKILHYERYPPDDTWNRHVLLVTDDDHPIFEDIAEQLAARLPADYVATKVYAGDYPPGDPTADIMQSLNSGSILATYIGHGSVDMWGLRNGGGPLFTLADITALTNTHRLPMVTVANCLNGFFVGSSTQVSVAEAFLRLPKKGAIAVWAPTSLGYPSDHLLLMRAFYEAIFRDGQYALGAATTAAKLAAFAQNSLVGELVETYVLFGDPILHAGIPLGTSAPTTRVDRE